AEVARPERFAAIVQERLRLDRLPAIGGGALAVKAALSGTVAAPQAVARLEWDEPELAGRRLRRAAVTAEGDLEELAWSLDLDVACGAILQAKGTAQAAEGSAEGSWSVAVADAAALAHAVAPDLGLELGGRLEGRGTLRLAGGQPEVEGRVEGWSLAAGAWRVDRLSAAVQADSGSAEVRELELELFGGSLGGELRLGLPGAEPDLQAHLVWQGLDTTALPLAVPEAAAGSSEGRLRVHGPLSAPEIEAEIGWTSSQAAPLVEHLGLEASLRDGVLEARTTELRSVLGAASASVFAPLGSFARPAWLWPEAPAGPASAQVAVAGLSSRPLLESLGRTAGFDAAGDLRAELRWDPADPGRPWAQAELTGLRISHPSGALVADGPVVARLDGGRLEVEPLVLSGLGSRFELEALADPGGGAVTARLRALVSEELARLAPLPLEVRGAITVEGELRLPAGEDLTAGLQGSVRVDHHDGAMVLRDPPLEVRGLGLDVEIGGGGIRSVDGAALVNGGSVDIGGAWDPATGQGLVLELDDVTFLVEGILTKWDGELAIEPRPDLIAEVVGDLELTAGLWDESFSITGVLLGGEELQLASDDPLHSIGLDLVVRGRSGIEVANNLGRFNASWNLLEVGGTLAAPRLLGEVRIAPGGTLALAGQEIRVRRGSLRFTGDPAVDPILEIVPESDLALSEGNFNATLVATRSLAGGLSSALGFENTTLRPAEIAVQTEKDPSTRFMVGRRLSSQLALFLATDLTDVQDRTTMLQAWNFPAAPGLVLQAYQETLNDEAGANLLQRFTWGGARASAQRPELARVRLEGEWPLSKRELRRATRLRRGQPYDPFLLFVASVRLERALAAAGYQSARVTGREEGEPRLPALVFSCEPGPRMPVEFEGDVPSRRLRGEATALYRPPPQEGASLVAMRALLERQLAAEGFPDAAVVVAREEAAVRVAIERGPELRLAGPVLVGLPAGVGVSLGPALSSPAALAAMSMDGPWATAVERDLARSGFHEARVLAIARVPTAPSLAEVRVELDPGPRTTIAELRIAGEDPLKLTAAESFRPRVGDPLDRPAIEHALRELRGAYIAAGYREAEVRWAVRDDAEVGAVLEMEVSPGRQRSLREIRVQGARHTSPEVLVRGVGLEPGEIVTDRSLDLGASRIATFAPIARVGVQTEPVGAT
ncbi:MAG: translocation/assembly module TamB domain-containing protein, partial [Thermoanaerobaculales bacterium]|nr:translocation/assembly module TamB domain-containing protein [Thermoanaerobaculales bacterium]